MTYPELFHALEQRRELAQSATDVISHSNELLDKLDEELSEIQHLGERFDTIDAERAALDRLHGVEDITDWPMEVSQQLLKDLTKFEHQMHDVTHDIEYLLAKVWETHKQIQTKFHEIEENLVDFEELIEDLQFRMSMNFSDHADQSLEATQSIHQLTRDSEEALSDFQNTISHDLFTDLDHQFENTKKTAQILSQTEIPQTTDRVMKEIEQSFVQLTQTSEQESARLMDEMVLTFTSTADFVHRDAIEQLSRTMGRLVHEALPTMEATMKHCLATMQHGAQIATAIDRWMPALKQVRETVGVVQIQTDMM